MNLTPIEVNTVLDALYDAEIFARRKAQENAAYGTDAGKERAKELRGIADVYKRTLQALLSK